MGIKIERLNQQPPRRIKDVSETEFCRLAGLPSPDSLRQQYHSMRDIRAAYPKLREDHLRHLQQWGLVRPAVQTNSETYFTFADLLVIKQAHAELERGSTFRSVLKALFLERQGQLAFDFRIDAPRAKIVQLPHPARRSESASPPGRRASTLAEQRFLEASALDEGDPDRLGEVVAAYRQALELDPTLVPALINLANVHYARDEFAEAQALCERAIQLDSNYFEAHFNLANLYHDRGDYHAARQHYLNALAHNPGYANAHFYLAVTLEKMGRSGEARPHWLAYQRLAPDGEWVELAREFSE